jgi:hypothetical protein
MELCSVSGDVLIRHAEPAEADDVGALVERVYRAGDWTDESYSKVLLDASSRIRDAAVLVAILKGSPVGAITIAEPGTPFANVGSRSRQSADGCVRGDGSTWRLPRSGPVH